MDSLDPNALFVCQTQNYIEETNFRVKSFDNIMKSSNNELKQALVELGLVSYICGSTFTNEIKFDLPQVKMSGQKLPFKEFLLFRNEAMAMMTSIVWNKVSRPRLPPSLAHSLCQTAHPLLPRGPPPNSEREGGWG